MNECLETGPSLQNSLWDGLIRSRFRPILMYRDKKKKAFLWDTRIWRGVKTSLGKEL